MQLYHREPSPAGNAGEIAPGGPKLAPYPILLRVRYFAETDEPLPAPAAPRRTSEKPNYLDASSPPPVRAPRAEPAPAALEEPKDEAQLEPVSAPVQSEPRAKPNPWGCPPERRKGRAPKTRGKLVAFLLLLVIVGLCVHWHALSLVPEYPGNLLSSLQPSESAEEMLVVPADGAPMLVEPDAEPPPQVENQTRPALAVETALPPLTPAATGWPVEPPPMAVSVPIEAAVAKPVETFVGRPRFVGLSKVPETGGEDMTISPAAFEQPASPETSVKPPVPAEFGAHILPVEEGGTP